MKALVLRNSSLEIEIVNQRKLALGDARLQVLHAGLCGSDIHKIENYQNSTPLILGHEFVGKVIDVKRGAFREQIGIQINDIVAACPTLPCNECKNCATNNDHLCESFHAIGRDIPGAFSEYVDIPVSNLIKIPENVSSRNIVLADVVAVCLHAIYEIAVDVAGKKCLVIGDGAIGSMMSAILHILGARSVSICGRHSENYKLLSSIIPVKRVHRDDADEYECVFETVGRSQIDTIQQAISNVGVRGKIIALGVFPPNLQISFNNRALFLKEASLTASVAYKQKYFFQAVEFLIAHPNLAELITQELVFRDFSTGLQLMKAKKDDSPVIKVVYRFDNNT